MPQENEKEIGEALRKGLETLKVMDEVLNLFCDCLRRIALEKSADPRDDARRTILAATAFIPDEYHGKPRS